MNIERLAERIRLIANEVAALAPEHDVSSQLGRLEILQAELARKIDRFKSSTALPNHHIFLLTEMLERSKASDPPARSKSEKIEGYDIPPEAIIAASNKLQKYVDDGVDVSPEEAVSIVLSAALPYVVPKTRVIKGDQPRAHPETDAAFRTRLFRHVVAPTDSDLEDMGWLTGANLDAIGSKYGLKRRGVAPVEK